MTRTGPAPVPFHPSRPGLVRPIPISKEAGLSRRTAAGPDWRRSSRGLYLPADLPERVEQRIVEAAMVCPRDGAITGWAALRWMCGGYFSGRYAGQELPITIAVLSRGFAKRSGIAVSKEFVHPDEIIEVDGVRVTVPEYSATFEARHAANGVDAVEALDMAMMFDLTSTDELIDFRSRRLFTTTGIAQLDAAISLSSENCWSPPETAMRVLWTVDRPESQLLVNWPVLDLDGRLIGRPDVIDPAAGVLAEYDGAPHDDPEQRVRDAQVDGAYQRVGLEIVRMTAGDLPAGHAFLDRLDSAYFRAQRRITRPRRWTTTLPAYWIPTQTVAQRRALTAEQRDRYLGWQRLPLLGSSAGSGTPSSVQEAA